MSEVDALISLLQDEDSQVAIIAMERLLTNPHFVKNDLRSLQESADPCLRSRIHQMESIISRQQQLDHFVDRVKENQIELWDDLTFLNKIIDRELSTGTINELFQELVQKCHEKELTTFELATFMREHGFCVPNEDILDPCLFLIYEVIASDLGSPLLLSIVAQQVARHHDKKLTIVLYKGRHCLVDEHSFFIDPQNGWTVTRLKLNSKVYPCTNRDILLTVISQLYLSALIEGQLRIISFLSRMMAALSNSSLEDFPFPVGKA